MIASARVLSNDFGNRWYILAHKAGLCSFAIILMKYFLSYIHLGTIEIA
jgi:hypothetical protein